MNAFVILTLLRFRSAMPFPMLLWLLIAPDSSTSISSVFIGCNKCMLERDGLDSIYLVGTSPVIASCRCFVQSLNFTLSYTNTNNNNNINWFAVCPKTYVSPNANNLFFFSWVSCRVHVLFYIYIYEYKCDDVQCVRWNVLCLFDYHRLCLPPIHTHLMFVSERKILIVCVCLPS